jgi:hypothetical protein
VTAPHCMLCKKLPAIKKSHVVPAFVSRAIKSDSVTGFLRNPNEPNRRIQDGEQVPLLCTVCEQRFSGPERDFSRVAFEPFHVNDSCVFEYGPWLHYFLVSLAWRDIVLNIPAVAAQTGVPKSIMDKLIDAETQMSEYLLGADWRGRAINAHLIAMSKVHTGSGDVMAAGPNVLLRRSAFHDVHFDKRNGYVGIVHNLAGLICVLIIKGNPRDSFYHTKVDPAGGRIAPPQRIRSWLMTQLCNQLSEYRDGLQLMSDMQFERLKTEVRLSKPTPAMRHWDADQAIRDR